MNYTINQLRIFLKVAQTRSVTKAAEELHLTQPAVSIQLKNFQQQFEIPLTEIVGRNIFITDFGKEVAVAAENILNHAYALNNKTQAHKGQLIGRLKFSIVSTGKYVMPYFLADFIRMNQGVEILLDVTNKAKVIESLRQNEVDFSLVSLLPDGLQLEKVELMQNKLFLVGSNNHKFKNKVYSKEIFRSIPLIYREEGSGTRQTMEKFIRKNNLPTQKKMELMSNEAVKQAVIAGLGYSVMPLIGIKNELQTDQLKIIPIKNFPIKSVWYLIWVKGKNHSPVALSYLNFLKKEKANIIKERFEWFEKY